MCGSRALRAAASAESTVAGSPTGRTTETRPGDKTNDHTGCLKAAVLPLVLPRFRGHLIGGDVRVVLLGDVHGEKAQIIYPRVQAGSHRTLGLRWPRHHVAVARRRVQALVRKESGWIRLRGLRKRTMTTKSQAFVLTTSSTRGVRPPPPATQPANATDGALPLRGRLRS